MFLDSTGSVDNFKIVGAVQFLTWKVQKLFCVNIYIDFEQVWAKFKMTMKITECYAVFINCFWNWMDWIGRDAKFFDTCQLSKDTEITLYEYKQDLDPWYFLGAKDIVTVTGTSCTPGYNEIIPLWRPVQTFG